MTIDVIAIIIRPVVFNQQDTWRSIDTVSIDKTRIAVHV